MKQVDLVGYITLTAGEDLDANVCVAIGSDGEVTAYDTTGGTAIYGVTMAAAEDGDPVAVKPKGEAGGTVLITTAEAIDLGDEVYVTTGGLIIDTDNGDPIGRALTAAASGALCEVVLYA